MTFSRSGIIPAAQWIQWISVTLRSSATCFSTAWSVLCWDNVPCLWWGRYLDAMVWRLTEVSSSRTSRLAKIGAWACWMESWIGMHFLTSFFWCSMFFDVSMHTQSTRSLGVVWMMTWKLQSLWGVLEVSSRLGGSCKLQNQLRMQGWVRWSFSMMLQLPSGQSRWCSAWYRLFWRSWWASFNGDGWSWSQRKGQRWRQEQVKRQRLCKRKI